MNHDRKRIIISWSTMSEFKDRLRDQPIKVNKLNAQEVRLTLDELVADVSIFLSSND